MSKKKKINEKIEFKIITLGEIGVGKTSVLRRFSTGSFIDRNPPTIGIDFSTKNVTLENGKDILLKFEDTSGQEKYKCLTKTYFKNTDAVFFVFSLYERNSFLNMKEWIDLFNENNNMSSGILKYLIGNKCDLEHNVLKEEIDAFLKENGDLVYFETSAKENIQIEKLFQEMSEKLYRNISSKKETKQISKLVHKGYNKPCCGGGDDD
jgi:small GTP-binding protein